MVNKTIIYIGLLISLLVICYKYKTSSIEHYHNTVINNKETFSKYNRNNHIIILVQQFHIPSSGRRYYEIKDTLRRNIQNKHIKKIYLLNERKYSNIELGSHSTKVKQIIINNRLKYSDFFKFIKKNYSISRLPTYFILSNNDIF